MIRKVLLLGVAGLLLGASAAFAFPPIDLTAAGSSSLDAGNGSNDGTIWNQLTDSPTGTGNIQPFLREQANGVEEGMNTDGDKNNTYDDVASIHTHGFTLGELQSVTVNGVSYFQFTCDLNEPQGGGKNLLSLDELRIYTLNGSSSLMTEAAVTGAGGVERYDMDQIADQDVYLDAAVSPGSGTGNFEVLIPTSFFAGASAGDQVYFYAKFGDTAGMIADADFSSEATFEEWRALFGPNTPPPDNLPEPSTVMILGTGLLGLAATRLRKK